MTSPSLLPPNATDLETALALLTPRLSDVPVPVKEVWSIWDCPAPLLPWLAWAVSVDHWDDTWPEATQRQVIAASYDVHARKGTPASIKAALAPLGMDIDLSEAWKTGGAPYTFGLTATVYPDAPASATAQASLLETLAATKPARAHLTDLQWRAIMGQDLGMARAVTASAVSAPTGLAAGRQRLDSGIVTGAVASAAKAVDAVGLAAGRSRLSASLSTSMALEGALVAATAGQTDGRNRLTQDIASALILQGQLSGTADGLAHGRNGLVAVGTHCTGLVSTYTVECQHTEDLSMIILRTPGQPTTVIKAMAGAVVAIQQDGTRFLLGSARQTIVQTLGEMRPAARGDTAITILGDPVDIRETETIVVDSYRHVVTLIDVAEEVIETVDADGNPISLPVTATTLQIHPPLPADRPETTVLKIIEV